MQHAQRFRFAHRRRFVEIFAQAMRVLFNAPILSR
jgi:hypothetical protein